MGVVLAECEYSLQGGCGEDQTLQLHSGGGII